VAEEAYLIPTLSSVIRALNQQGVNYALAGGLAYSALVEPRATTDVDLLILLENPSPDKVAGLFSSVFDSLVPHPGPMVFKGIPIWRVVGVLDEKEVVVDLLIAQSDFLRQALARKRTVDFLGLPLPIVTLEDLVILKAMAGRLQDRADLEKIKQQPDLQVDWDYVRHWQEKLGLQTL
jgi:predicted nucleotidyltransferase